MDHRYRIVLSTLFLGNDRTIEALELSILLQRNALLDCLKGLDKSSKQHDIIGKCIALGDKLILVLKNAEGDWKNVDKEVTKKLQEEFMTHLQTMNNHMLSQTRASDTDKEYLN